MRYKRIIKAYFAERYNRFVSRVEINGTPTDVHVKNTGRCKELLIPGATVYLSDSENSERKYRYDLIAVEKQTENGVLLINMDSSCPNDAVAEWLPKSGILPENAYIKREYTHGKSRFDFYFEAGDERGLIEVKGVTLENNGIVSFPDAPTERGRKHLLELAEAVKEGYYTAVIFVVQMDGVKCFRPNEINDPDFASALRKAEKSGVRLFALSCKVTPDSVNINGKIPIEL